MVHYIMCDTHSHIDIGIRLFDHHILHIVYLPAPKNRTYFVHQHILLNNNRRVKYRKVRKLQNM